MINNYVDEKRCCGCENCVLVCPKQAIKMEQDKEGFFNLMLMRKNVLVVKYA